MKKLRKRPFTLVEILVSMAVFSILLMLMVQFFSNARTLWTANEKRSAVYADASVAMNLMSMLLQTTFYTEGGTPFQISNAPASSTAARPGTGWNSSLMFVSSSAMNLPGSAVRYLRFQRGTGNNNDPDPGNNRPNVLQLRVFCDEDANFSQCFQPFGVSLTPSETEQGARNCVNTFLDGAAAARIKPILRNVTGLKFLPVNREGRVVYSALPPSEYKGVVYDSSNNCVSAPAGIEIEISLMPDEAAAREWAAMAAGTAKDDFRTKNEYTFRRTVWLGDRTFNQ